MSYLPIDILLAYRDIDWARWYVYYISMDVEFDTTVQHNLSSSLLISLRACSLLASIVLRYDVPDSSKNVSNISQASLVLI